MDCRILYFINCKIVVIKVSFILVDIIYKDFSVNFSF